MRKYTIIGPMVLVAIWALAAWLHIVDAFFLPDPWTVIKKLIELVASGSIMGDLFSTVQRVAAAFIISLIIGLPLGLWLGRSAKLYQSAEFIIDFFRSTPATALIPLFILVFGISDVSKIAVAAFASIFIIVFNTAQGVIHRGKAKTLAVQIMGATPLQIFRLVTFWESLPQTCIGLRLAINWSIVSIVVTEMFIGTTSGLGRKIIDSQITYEIPTMYATILLTGVLGYVLNLLFIVAEKRFLHWIGK